MLGSLRILHTGGMRPRHHSHHFARHLGRVPEHRQCRRRPARRVVLHVQLRLHVCVRRTELPPHQRRLRRFRRRPSTQLRILVQLLIDQRILARRVQRRDVGHHVHRHQQLQRRHRQHRPCGGRRERKEPHQGTGAGHTRLRLHDARLALLLLHRERPGCRLRTHLA